jgi:hypothetical protein
MGYTHIVHFLYLVFHISKMILLIYTCDAIYTLNNKRNNGRNVYFIGTTFVINLVDIIHCDVINAQ